MRIAVCFKNVPDEHEMKVDANRDVDFSRASLSIGAYDLNAVEAGAALLDDDATIDYIALTAGDARSTASKLKKDVLARGPHRLVVIQDGALADADCLATARALAAGIRAIGDVDLALFGEGSGDRYNQQVGLLTGALLGWPALNGVRAIGRDGESLVVERSLEDAVERIAVRPPCALSVTSDGNRPRISGMRAILAAGKKPMDVIASEGEGGASEVVSVKAPEKADRKRFVLEGADGAAVEEFFQLLRKAL